MRRKLSLLEEKRAIFQGRFFDSTSKDTQSGDTVIAVNIDDNNPCNTIGNNFLDRHEEERKRKARQISVRTFDTFSSLEGILLEEASADCLENIEDYTDSYNRMDNNYSRFHDAMAAMVGIYIQYISVMNQLDKGSSPLYVHTCSMAYDRIGFFGAIHPMFYDVEQRYLNTNRNDNRFTD